MVKSEAAIVRRRAYQKRYVNKNRGRYNAHLRAWCKANPERRFLRYLRHRLKKKYGLTIEQYQAIIKRQAGVCPLCCRILTVPDEHNRIRNGQSAVVDHKGQTVRGVLCNACNRALGLFHDNVAVLKNAILYLERNENHAS